MPAPEKASRPLDGLVWPLVPNSKNEGDRSTTWANKEALSAAVGAVDPALAQQILAEKKWRQNYTRYVYKHVVACLQSRDAAVASAQAGLDWVHNHFEFVRNGTSMPLAEAMSSISGSFETGVVTGSKPKPASTVLEVRVCTIPCVLRCCVALCTFVVGAPNCTWAKREKPRNPHEELRRKIEH